MKTITILLIEDNSQDIRLIKEMLKEINSFNYHLVTAITVKEGCEQIQRNNFDIILLDLNLPDSTGLQTFQKIIDCCKEIPVVLITGIEDEELSLKLIMEGAQDYINKYGLNAAPLGKSILYSIERQALLKKIKIQNVQIDRIETERILIAKLPSQNPDPILRVAGNGKLLYINEAGIKLLPDWQLIINEIIPSSLKVIIDPIFIEGTNIKFELCHREFIYSFYAVPFIEEGYINLYGRDITERKRAEDTSRVSEEKHRAILQTAIDGFWMVDMQGRLLEVNETYCRMSGYSVQELMTLRVTDIDVAQSSAYIVAHIQKIKSQGEGRFETKHRRKDGSIFDVEISVQYKFIENERFVVFIQDISERKLVEQKLFVANKELAFQYDEKEKQATELIKSKQLLVETARLARIGGWEIILKNNELSWSDEVYQIHEVEPDYQPTVESGINFYAPEARPVITEALRQLIEGGKSFDIELQLITAKQKKIWVRAIGQAYRMNGEIMKIGGMFQNINEHKLEKEALYQSYAFSESLLKTIPFGMDIVDEEGTVLFQSDNFKSLFGVESIGKKCWDLYCDNKTQCSNCPLKIGITIGETEIYESQGILGDRIFEIIHTGMIYQQKKAILEIFHDITDKKVKEQELIRAKEHAEESDRLKSAFLCNMSHEIRTPMNGILGFAELLKEPGLTGEEQQQYIRIIEKSGARMLNIINDIVDISKIESGQMEVSISETNVNEKIEYIYTFFKPEVERKRIQLFYKNLLPAKEAIIQTDREKIYAILTNLVKNAIKFTKEGSIEFGYEKKGEYLEFFVKDTGVGIRQEKKKIIFERFRQGSESLSRNYEGSGLGLSISKAFVEMLGGRIWVESTLGKGSIFYFTIPYNAKTQTQSVITNVVSGEDKEDQLINLKILVIDDDETSGMFITVVVEKFSHEVLHAMTGIEAIEACRNNPDIDLILMDIKMAKMNGFEATRQIRQFNKDVVIIAQTAYALKGDREKAIEAGCNDYISKPIKKDELLALIQKHFNKLEID